MDVITANKQISLITLVALLTAIIAAISVPRLRVPGTVKQITLNPLVRFLLYFGIAFVALKVMAFAMVAALLAVIVTYLIEMFYYNEPFTVGEEKVVVNNTTNNQQVQVQDVESHYIDDISEMSVGKPRRSVDGTAVTGLTLADDGKDMGYSLYSDESAPPVGANLGKESYDAKYGKDGIVGYDGSNKYASV